MLVLDNLLQSAYVTRQYGTNKLHGRRQAPIIRRRACGLSSGEAQRTISHEVETKSSESKDWLHDLVSLLSSFPLPNIVPTC